jgi:hypothetical protein
MQVTAIKKQRQKILILCNVSEQLIDRNVIKISEKIQVLNAEDKVLQHYFQGNFFEKILKKVE